jgi:hypothetical protein
MSVRSVWGEIDALWKRLKEFQRQATIEGGGIHGAAHAATHADGDDDELDITTIGGFTGDPADVLRGDGTWGPALGAAGAGQWIHLTSGTEPAELITDGNGHPVMVWWGGP